MAASGELLEHAYVFGRSYGTPRAPVEAALASGRDVLFDIDWQGFRQLRAAMPADVVGVFIKPPSLDELRARLQGRGDDAAQVERRMAHAEAEIAHAGEFDFIVENADFDTALADLRAMLRASRLATRGRCKEAESFRRGSLKWCPRRRNKAVPPRVATADL